MACLSDSPTAGPSRMVHIGNTVRLGFCPLAISQVCSVVMAGLARGLIKMNLRQVDSITKALGWVRFKMVAGERHLRGCDADATLRQEDCLCEIACMITLTSTFILMRHPFTIVSDRLATTCVPCINRNCQREGYLAVFLCQRSIIGHWYQSSVRAEAQRMHRYAGSVRQREIRRAHLRI